MDDMNQNPETKSDQIGGKNILEARVLDILAKLSDAQLSQFYHTIMMPYPIARQQSASMEWFPLVETLFEDGDDLSEEVRGAVFGIANDRLHGDILFPVAPDTDPFCIYNRHTW